jgi:hypothetical protein
MEDWNQPSNQLARIGDVGCILLALIYVCALVKQLGVEYLPSIVVGTINSSLFFMVWWKKKIFVVAESIEEALSSANQNF